MEKIRRRVWCNVIVLHLVVKAGFSAKCGNSCCVNFYQIPNGSCIECPLGTHGANCTGKCVSGFYGKLCQSPCTCRAESCNKSYGCVKGNAAMGKESTREWVNVSFAIIGPISAVAMCLIGLLFYLKSWISKTSALSRVTNQLYTDQTDDQEELGGESSSSLSTTTETVLQRTNYSYADMRFSRVQPQYDNSKDYESVMEQDALSDDSRPSHKVIHGHAKDEHDEANCKGKYERMFKNKAYNVLSLRKPPIEKAMTLQSVDSSANLMDNIDEMEDEYDLIEMKEENKEEYVSERRTVQIHPTGKDLCRESSIGETVKDYIRNAQMNRKCDIIVHKGAISKCCISQELDCTKSFSPRPYSLAKSIWRKHHTSEMSNQPRISDYEEV